jgi:hypothetical protein
MEICNFLRPTKNKKEPSLNEKKPHKKKRTHKILQGQSQLWSALRKIFLYSTQIRLHARII